MTIKRDSEFTPFRPEFTMVIFIHYKPLIAIAFLDLWWMKIIWCGLKMKENCHVLVNQFHVEYSLWNPWLLEN